MNNIVPSQISQTTPGTLALALSAAMAAGHPAWPVPEAPTYMIWQTAPSYSKVSEQVMTAAKRPAVDDFSDKITSIYVSLSERQERLGADIEAAIFDDLDSLYES